MSFANTVKFICDHPLNRGRALHALATFLRWQIASRLLPQHDFVVPWVNGAKFRVRHGQTGLTGNIYTGLHEFEEMAFLLHYLRSEDLFVDVGANVGSYTILAGAAVRSACLAIEPVPSTFDALVENVRLNHSEPRTECVNAALGAAYGTIEFTTDADTVNHVLADAEARISTLVVPVRTLDSVLQGRHAALIKVDVEGYETQVMAGATNMLGSGEPMALIMELNGSGSRYGFNEDALLQTMFASGFEAFRYDPVRRQLHKLEAKNASAGNTIFIRGEYEATRRLREAAQFTVGTHQI